MRRLCAIATFASLTFFLQVSALPLVAQHGGGHASSGGHGGGGGGFGGHSSLGGGGFGGHSSFGGHSGYGGYSAPHSSVHAYSGPSSRPLYSPRAVAPMRSLGGSRSYTPAFRSPQQAFSANRSNSRNRLDSRNRFGFGNRFGNRFGGRRFRDHDRGFRGPWRYGYPGWYGYYDPYWYDPYWLWDSSSSYDDDQNQDPSPGNEMNEQGYDGPSPEDQSARDSYDSSGDQDIYARSAPYEPRHSELTAPSPPTTLVFRDQHKEEIQNYAIVGNTLWNFSPLRTQKIPLSEIDIPATTKVNDDRGVSFKMPN